MVTERYTDSPRFHGIVMPSLQEVSQRQEVDLYDTRDKFGQKLRLGIRITDTETANTTIIRPMPVTDEVGRVQLADDQGVYRQLSGARIIGVDFPSMGSGSGPLTDSQKINLSSGSFKEVADAQWQAIGEALDRNDQTYKDLGRVILWGTSLGGAEVAGLYATKPEGVEISDVVFQITPWRTALNGLLRGFATAGKDRGYYYALDGENYNGRESDMQWAKRIASRRKLGSFVRSSLALTKGGAMADYTSRRLKGVRTHIMNAEHDGISPSSDNLEAVKDLKELNANVEYTLMNGEYHAIQQSRLVVGVQQRDIIESY